MKYDEETYKELKQGLRVNREMLDEENIAQPNNFFHASEGFAYAVSNRDKKKYDLDRIIAELDNDIRDNLLNNDEKVTEVKVKNQLHLEVDYQAAYKEWLRACLNADKWEALKNAYRMRNDSLRNLVMLHNANYFGEITGAAERRESRERFDSRRHA